MKVLLLCFILPFIATVLFAAEVSLPFATEHAELFQWFLGLCIVALGFFLHRTLTTIERNNNQQWKAISLMNTRLAVLEGEHKAYHVAGGRRNYDPEERIKP